MPVALIGRLAIDTRAQGRRLGEKLLTEAKIDDDVVVEAVGLGTHERSG
jgi:hypothetical protein